MRLRGNGKPNVKLLARHGDTDGLINAVFYRERRAGAGTAAGDSAARLREEAVKALEAVGPDEGGPAVLDALTDSSDLVRSAAVGVLARWGDTRPLAEAVGWLPADRGHARRLALLALAQIARPGTASALAHALVHAVDDESLRPGDAGLVLQLLAAEKGPDAVPEVIDILVAALGDEREAVGERAADLLVRLGPASSEALAIALHDLAVPRAAAVLGKIGDPSALEPLIEALEDPNPRLRAECCYALGELRMPSAVEALLSATHDIDPAVRASAAAALDELGNAALILGISQLLRTETKGAVGPAARRRRTTTNGRRQSDPNEN